MNVNGWIYERAAADYLRKKHYKLLDYNYTSRFGEIDLIMKKGKYLVFVEVKQRSVNSAVRPKEFVDDYKQQKMIKTASLYLVQTKSKLQPRFDVVEIICENNQIKSIEHLENAFTLD